MPHNEGRIGPRASRDNSRQAELLLRLSRVVGLRELMYVLMCQSEGSDGQAINNIPRSSRGVSPLPLLRQAERRASRRQLPMINGVILHRAKPFTQAEPRTPGGGSGVPRREREAHREETVPASRRPEACAVIRISSKYKAGLNWRPRGGASPARYDFGASTSHKPVLVQAKRQISKRSTVERGRLARDVPPPATPSSRWGNKNIQHRPRGQHSMFPGGLRQDTIGAHRGSSGFDNAPACVRRRMPGRRCTNNGASMMMWIAALARVAGFPPEGAASLSNVTTYQ